MPKYRIPTRIIDMQLNAKATVFAVAFVSVLDGLD